MIAKHQNTIIREPEETDLMLLFLWENTPAFQLHELGNRKRYDLSTMKAHLSNVHEVEKNGQMRMMIENIDNHTIGVVDLFDMDFSNSTAKIGILIADKKHRGQGHAFNAILMMMAHAAIKWQIKSFFAEVKKDNLPSFVLFKKLQARWELLNDGSHAERQQLEDKYIFSFHLGQLHGNFTIFE